MAKASLPFYALFVGDGSTTAFTLDVSRDPFYFANDITNFNASETLPSSSTLSSDFDHKNYPSGVAAVKANRADNNTDYSFSSATVDGYQITFNLGSAPVNNIAFAVQGFIQY